MAPSPCASRLLLGRFLLSLPLPVLPHPLPGLRPLALRCFIMAQGKFQLQAKVFGLFLGRCDPYIGDFLPGLHQFLHQLQNLVLGAHRGRNLAPLLLGEILGDTVCAGAPD